MLPTKALLEFCLNTLMTLKESAPQLEAGLDNEKNQISRILSQLIVTGDNEQMLMKKTRLDVCKTSSLFSHGFPLASSFIKPVEPQSKQVFNQALY